MATATLRSRATNVGATPPAEFDRSLVWVTALLLGLGLVMVYSASIGIAEAGRGGEDVYLGKREGLHGGHHSILNWSRCSTSRPTVELPSTAFGAAR